MEFTENKMYCSITLESTFIEEYKILRKVYEAIRDKSETEIEQLLLEIVE